MPPPSYGARYIFTCDFLLGIYCDVQRNTSYIHHLLRIHHIRVGRDLRLTDNQQAIRTTTIPACPLWPLLRRGTVMSMDGFFRYATDFPNTHLIAGNSPWLSSATCRFRNPDPASWLPRRRKSHFTGDPSSTPNCFLKKCFRDIRSFDTYTTTIALANFSSGACGSRRLHTVRRCACET